MEIGKRAAFIVADDLTGACDAAAAFALRGLETTVACGNSATEPGCDVIALSTETRDETGNLQRQVSKAVKLLEHDKPRIAMKKIDSMFRGNSFEEIRLWTELLPEYVAVLAPAFPAVGRFVRDGALLAEGKKSDLLQELQYYKLDCESIPARSSGAAQLEEMIQIAMRKGKRLLLFDAESMRDLAEIAEAVDGSCRRILWIGSGGLATALAARLPNGRSNCEKPQRDGRMIFCIGSGHDVSCRQVEKLKMRATILELNAAGELDALERELVRGHDVLLRIPFRYEDPLRLGKTLYKSLRVGVAGLLLSGGSTAATVCQALEAEAIGIGGEVLPGIPWGVLRGGPADGVPVITKSGGFGEPDALIVAASFFRGQKKEIHVRN